MKKTILLLVSLNLLLFSIYSCTFFKGPLDDSSQFSRQLTETENYINNGEWKKAEGSLKSTEKTWNKIRPLLQIDIDHDYVNDIEENFIKLKAYLKGRDKSNSSATIMLIQRLWQQIDQM